MKSSDATRKPGMKATGGEDGGPAIRRPDAGGDIPEEQPMMRYVVDIPVRSLSLSIFPRRPLRLSEPSCGDSEGRPKLAELLN